MIGMVLVTHGRLAIEFRAAMEHVVGPQQQVETITIGPEDDMDQRRSDIVAAVQRVDTGDGVVILTDMFGGTPSNLAISVMNGGKTEVVAGINLLALKDCRFAIGAALLEWSGECHPCSRMEEILGPGGYHAVRHHGGITARVLEGGAIRIGDPVRRVERLPVVTGAGD